LQPKDRKLLYDAAMKKAKSITLSDGRKFSIQYQTLDSVAWGKYEAIFVRPADGSFVPNGWFRIKSLLKEV
jgi:hypothetical protein